MEAYEAEIVEHKEIHSTLKEETAELETELSNLKRQLETHQQSME